jgi:hypothetical protein
MVDEQHRVVFALTSEGRDVFSAMTRVAVASIRLTNPNISISVCCDAETDRALRLAGDPLRYEVDEWRPEQTPAGHAGFRNRFVKTRLRETLDGAFLFLDSDVLVRGDLSEVFAYDADVVGARNHSRNNYADQIWQADAQALHALGWSVRHDVYINGGVLLYKDSDGARRFAEDWHRRWLHCFKARGDHRDQPALNAALQATQVRLQVLPDRFNAQFRVNLGVAPTAVVWHYYSSGAGRRPATQFESLVEDLRRGDRLDPDRVALMVRARHPWRAQTLLGEVAFARVVARGQVDGWEGALLGQDLRGYVERKVGSLGRRAWRLVRNPISLLRRT